LLLLLPKDMRSVHLFLGNQGGETLNTKHGPKGVNRHLSQDVSQQQAAAAAHNTGMHNSTQHWNAQQHTTLECTKKGRVFWLGYSC
jgi:hypothetical protein